MDGTLWNSARQVAEAWSTVSVKQLGKAVTEEDMYRVMGMPMDKLAMTLFPGHELPELLGLMKVSGEIENEYLRKNGAVIYPKLEETLQILRKDYPLYIVSNCQSGYIEAFLEYYGFGKYFEDFVCYGENEKPKSENIALIIQRNQLDRGIYVGDIQADYDAAIAGGAEFIHAAYGFGTVREDVPVIHKFSELPDVLHSKY